MGKSRPITVSGIAFNTVVDACIYFGIGTATVYSRLKQSNDIEWAFGQKEIVRRSPHRKALTSSYNLKAKFPLVCREWDTKKNSSLRPNDVTPGSGKIVWWRCLKNAAHQWQAPVRVRVPPKQTACPFCIGKRALPTNQLSVQYPKIADEFATDLNNQALNEVTVKSGKRFWWRLSISTQI